MTTQINVGGIPIEVSFKKIKNIHLSVSPPDGSVRISAPAWITLETIRLHVIAKTDWIKRQQKKIQSQEREGPREYLDRESHYLWGKRYLLEVQEENKAPKIEIRHRTIVLTVRPKSSRDTKNEVFLAWYRDQLRESAVPMIRKWELILGVKTSRLFVQRMKTRWGTCNVRRQSIRLNSELAKKPLECLEYVIVHELVHLLEPSHNHRFISYMDEFIPKWRQIRQQLNQAPIGHPDWDVNTL